MKWLNKKVNVHFVSLTEEQSQTVLKNIAKIENIKPWMELWRQAGYQSYAKTDDKRFLGIVDFINTLEVDMEKLTKPVEVIEPDNGYQSTVG